MSDANPGPLPDWIKYELGRALADRDALCEQIEEHPESELSEPILDRYEHALNVANVTVAELERELERRAWAWPHPEAFAVRNFPAG